LPICGNMKLVKPQDLVKASPFIQDLGGENFAKILMHLLRDCLNL